MEPPQGPLFPFRAPGPGGLWGYIDREGCIAIEPQFLAAGPFVAGRAIAGPADGGTVIVDPAGEQHGMVSDTLDEECVSGYWWTRSPDAAPAGNAFHDGMLVGCHDRGGLGFYDGEARFVPLLLQGFDRHRVEGFAGGLARVETRREVRGDRRVVYVGVDGRPATPFFDAGSAFSDGLALVRGEVTGYIDDQGQVVLTPDHTFLQSFSEGLAAVHGGYIDRQGVLRVQVDPTDEYHPFVDGRARFHRGATYGFLDVHGEITIPARFTGALDFSGGLAAVATEGGWGYVQTDGAFVVGPHLDSAGPHVEGLARVSVRDPGDGVDPPREISGTVYRVGYLDTAGHWVRAWWEVAEVVEGTPE